MESLVSLGDVELEDEGDDMLNQSQLGGRYVEECDYGGEMEGIEEEEGGRERGEGQGKTMQSVSPVIVHCANRMIKRNIHVYVYTCTSSLKNQ